MGGSDDIASMQANSPSNANKINQFKRNDINTQAFMFLKF